VVGDFTGGGATGACVDSTIGIVGTGVEIVGEGNGDNASGDATGANPIGSNVNTSNGRVGDRVIPPGKCVGERVGTTGG